MGENEQATPDSVAASWGQLQMEVKRPLVETCNLGT